MLRQPPPLTFSHMQPEVFVPPGTWWHRIARELHALLLLFLDLLANRASNSYPDRQQFLSLHLQSTMHEGQHLMFHSYVLERSLSAVLCVGQQQACN